MGNEFKDWDSLIGESERAFEQGKIALAELKIKVALKQIEGSKSSREQKQYLIEVLTRLGKIYQRKDLGRSADKCYQRVLTLQNELGVYVEQQVTKIEKSETESYVREVTSSARQELRTPEIAGIETGGKPVISKAVSTAPAEFVPSLKSRIKQFYNLNVDRQSLPAPKVVRVAQKINAAFSALPHKPAQFDLAIIESKFRDAMQTNAWQNLSPSDWSWAPYLLFQEPNFGAPSVSIICETVLAGKFSEVGRPSR